MAVADCYDALRSERYYKTAASHADSRDTILRESGRHFDPEVVGAFCAVEESFGEVVDRLTETAPDLA